MTKEATNRLEIKDGKPGGISRKIFALDEEGAVEKTNVAKGIYEVRKKTLKGSSGAEEADRALAKRKRGESGFKKGGPEETAKSIFVRPEEGGRPVVFQERIPSGAWRGEKGR